MSGGVGGARPRGCPLPDLQQAGGLAARFRCGYHGSGREGLLRRSAMRVWTILLSIISVTAFSFAADKGTSTAPATQPAAEIYKLKKGTLKLEVTTDGTLSALEPFEVKLKTKAYAGQFTVLSAAVHGAMVRKGESILEIDPKPINWAVEGAEGELATARANLKKAEADA